MNRKRVLRHGSLFSGIGGFDLAADWMGWVNVFHCETDPFCRSVLKYYFPKAKSYGNIKEADFTPHKGDIDILTGGFPCQPFSIAGKRLGKEDERHLWPHMLRAVREIRPEWVLGENVRGIISWNEGLVFEEVQADLEAEGYEVQPYVLPAAGINAPHRRERVWFIAHSNCNGQYGGNSEHEIYTAKGRQYAFGDPQQGIVNGIATDTNSLGGNTCISSSINDSRRENKKHFPKGDEVRNTHTAACRTGSAADTLSVRCDNGSYHRKVRHLQSDERIATQIQQEREIGKCRTGASGTASAHPSIQGLEGQTGKRVQTGSRGSSQFRSGESARNDRTKNWEDFPQAQPTIRVGNDGIPNKLDFDAIFQLLPGQIMPITFSKWRTESIKALGNAIIPQLAYQIFKTIELTINKLKKVRL